MIIGAGTIGLCTLVATRTVQPNCDITVLAKYDFQAEIAKQFGATVVIDGKEILDYIVKKTDAVLYKGYFGNKTLIGGFDIIYDCVGTSKTVHNALIWTKGRGTVVIIGVDFHQGKLDLNPIWYQEVDLIGSLIHGIEEWEGKSISTYKLVTNLLEQKKINPKITEIITHRFPLKDYREAINIAMNKRKSKAIKVIFDYEL